MVGSDTQKGTMNHLVETFPAVVSNGCRFTEEEGGKKKKSKDGNLQTSWLAITEPDSDDDFTGDKEAHMASVLARFRKSLIERTTHHMGTHFRALSYVTDPHQDSKS